MIASLIALISGSHIYLVIGAVIVFVHLALGALQALFEALQNMLVKLGDANAASAVGKICAFFAKVSGIIATIITWCGFNQ